MSTLIFPKGTHLVLIGAGLEYLSDMGVPYKKGKGWAFRVDLGPDPTTGRRRQVLRQGYFTRKAAQDFQAELRTQAAQGRTVTRSSAKVDESLIGATGSASSPMP